MGRAEYRQCREKHEKKKIHADRKQIELKKKHPQGNNDVKGSSEGNVEY